MIWHYSNLKPFVEKGAKSSPAIPINSNLILKVASPVISRKFPLSNTYKNVFSIGNLE